ncbi:hypothetical protein ACK3ZB_11330, partial [Aeromonas caviae]
LMMNPAPWLQMTNMISYQGLVRTFPKLVGNMLYPYPGRLVEVILGMNISQDDELRVRNAIRASGYTPNYFKLKAIEDDYGYAKLRLPEN